MTERRTALITGASAGIGREIARLCAADGLDVVLVARRRERLQELAEELAAHGVRATPLKCDLADPAAVAALPARLNDAGFRVDVLVNNAGFGSNGPFAEQDLGRELGMVRLNVEAVVHLTGLLLPGMLERGYGRVLNIASTAAFQAGPFMATYFATKAFVLSFSEALSFETRGTGVTVTASCPGATESEFGATAGNDASNLFAAGAADGADVARHAYEAMKRGKPVAIHGFKNAFGAHSVRFTPRAVVRAVAAKLNQPAKK